MPFPPGPGTQPAAITQEQQILAQARGALSVLLPRLDTTTKSLETLHQGERDAGLAFSKGLDNEGALYLLKAIFRSQEIQLTAALEEGNREREHLEKVIAQITSPVKIFRPSFPSSEGGAA